jgi:hypothetical protein
MLKKSIVLLPFVILFYSCQTDYGKKVTQEFELDLIESITLGVSAEVVIEKGSSQKVVITGPEKIVDKLMKEVDSGQWNIRFPDNKNRNYEQLKITITSDQIKQVSLRGSGSIIAKDPQPISNVMLFGLGEIQLNTSSSKINAVLSGSGNIGMTGKTENASFIISGLGSINGYALPSNKVSVVISGNGRAQVNAESSLNAIISGLGNIQYIGKPSVTTSISGSGTVVDAN